MFSVSLCGFSVVSVLNFLAIPTHYSFFRKHCLCHCHQHVRQSFQPFFFNKIRFGAPLLPFRVLQGIGIDAKRCAYVGVALRERICAQRLYTFFALDCKELIFCPIAAATCNLSISRLLISASCSITQFWYNVIAPFASLLLLMLCDASMTAIVGSLQMA
jgi:hypothetical protein